MNIYNSEADGSVYFTRNLAYTYDLSVQILLNF